MSETTILTLEEVKAIRAELVFAQTRSNARTNENQIKEILNPLIESGFSIQREIISYMEGLGNIEFSENQIEIISEMDDAQLAELAFVMSILTSNEKDTLQNSSSAKQVVDPTLRAGVGVALGIAGIEALYANTLALGTVETALGALRLLGKRYLGYVGIAWMILDFTDCYYGILGD